jgi:acetylornithine deacetylase/succinyl-diaminopimelate desuccinylase-like protein
MRPLPSLFLSLFALTSFAARAQNPVEAARQWRIHHQSEILQGFTTLLSIPNVAADPANLRRNADTLVSLLQQRHFETRLLSIPGVPPVVYGEQQTRGAKHTIVFYAHYDGQPLTPSE